MGKLLFIGHLAALVLGAATILIGGYYLLADWVAGDRAFLYFQQLVKDPQARERELFWAFASVQAHRINFWGELTGMLLGALIGTVGLVGLELNRRA